MNNFIERWRKAFPTTLILGSVINMISPGQAQSAGEIEWTCINNGLPNDIQLEKLAIDPLNQDTIYTIGQGGIYKSSNGGNSWTNINNNLPFFPQQGESAPMSSVALEDLAIDPLNQDTIYTIGQGGTYKSPDGGTNWTNINNDLPFFPQQGESAPISSVALEDLAIDPTDSDNIYLASNNGQVFKSNNQGDNWVEITNNLPISQRRQGNMNIAVAKVGNPQPIYIGNWQGIYKSIDDGQTWTQIDKAPLSDNPYIYDLVLDNQDNIYVSSSAGLYKSADGGGSWNTLSSQQYLDNLTFAPSNNSILYASKGSKVYQSIDGGINWTSKSNGLPASINNIFSLAIDPTGTKTVYACVESYSKDEVPVRAVYKTVDGGDSWTQVITLSPAASGKNIAIGTNTHIYLAGIGINKSTNNGGNWSLMNNGLPHYVTINDMAIDLKNTGTIYFVNWRGVFKTTDYGVSWETRNANLNIYYSPLYSWYQQFKTIAIDPNSSNTIYLAGCKGCYKSTDGGNNWGSITNGLSPQYFDLTKIVIDPKNSNLIYAVTSEWNKIYKTTNGGNNWNNISLSINDIFTNLFITPGTSTLYGIGGWNGGIYRSNDQGQSWTKLLLPGDMQISTIVFGSNTSGSLTLYASGYERFYQETIDKTLKSTDDGNSWIEINDVAVSSLIIHPQFPFLFYGISEDGVIKSSDEGKNWACVNEGLPGPKKIMGSFATTSCRLIMDKLNPNIFYLAYPPYGIYLGTDTNSAPAPPLIHTPANNSSTSDNTPLIIGESQAGSLIYIYNAANLLGTTTADSNNLFVFTCGTLALGQRTLNFIAVDPFGTSSPTTIIINIIAGVIPTIDNLISGATNQATVTITGIAEEGSTVVIYDGSTPIGTTTATNGIYSHLVVLKDGWHKLYIKSTNVNGVVATSDVIDLLIDTFAPPPPWILEPRWETKSSNTKPSVKGKTISNGKVKIYDNGLPIGTVTADGSGNFEFTPQTALSEGTHFITARVIDSANNISPSSWQVKVIIDLKPVIVHPRSGKTNNGTPTISGTAPPGTEVEIWIDNTKIDTANVTSAETFSYQLITPLSNGTHTIKAKNTSGASNEVRLIVDVQSPVDKINVEVKQTWREATHPDENDKVRGIRNRPMDVTIPIKGNPSTVTITIKSTGEKITLVDKGDGTFVGSFTPTSSSEIEITIIDEKGSSTTLPLMKVELIDPAGYVYNKVTYEKVTGELLVIGGMELILPGLSGMPKIMITKLTHRLLHLALNLIIHFLCQKANIMSMLLLPDIIPIRVLCLK